VKQATASIPIVFATAGDPVGTGLVESLASPGGNVTDLSNQSADVNGKRHHRSGRDRPANALQQVAGPLAALNVSGKRPFSFRSHEIARINHLITNQLDLMRSSFAFRFYEFRTWKNGSDERALRTFGTGVWGRGFR
jgi:hypothetical protein